MPPMTTNDDEKIQAAICGCGDTCSAEGSLCANCVQRLKQERDALLTMVRQEDALNMLRELISFRESGNE